MSEPMKILHLEDSDVDARLVAEQLRKGGVAASITLAITRQEFETAIGSGRFDLILSDNSVAGLNGIEALRLVRALAVESPFIFVTGTIGEEAAIEIMRDGATDYVLKHQLTKLPLAVHRAVHEATDRARRLQLEEQLRHAQKMEAVGLLAGGIAHDFNNILSIILGYAQMLRDEPNVPTEGREILATIVGAGERAALLTRQLLAFSRKQVLAPRVLDLNMVLGNVQKMLRRLIGEDIALEIHLGSDTGNVLVDPTQIEQVIINLAVNARDAMPEGGTLVIATSRGTIRPERSPLFPSARPGECVVLSVSDSGSGMAPEVRDHIFEPFFTTKEKGKGTGLGLATVLGIVQQSGGMIEVETAPGSGTRFLVCLPRVDAPPETVETQPVHGEPSHGTETVLVVEDEDSLRTLIARILRRRGYTVLEADSGSEAIETCEMHEGSIDLVITDVILPQMAGPIAFDRIREKRPEARVLYISGYTDRAILTRSDLDPARNFLEKPFTPAALLERVRQVLD